MTIIKKNNTYIRTMETQEKKIPNSEAEGENKKTYSKPTVALKTFATSATVLKNHNLITEEEFENLKKLQRLAIEKYMGKNMFG